MIEPMFRLARDRKEWAVPYWTRLTRKKVPDTFLAPSICEPLRSLLPQGCRWKTLFMIFHSPSTFSSVNKSVNR